MSQLALPQLDWGKLLSTTFPGLVLAVVIYMAVDVISREELTAKALSGNSEVLGATIASFVTFSTLLGVLLDSIGHGVFEENVRRNLTRIREIEADRRIQLWIRGRRPWSFYSIYRVEVEDKYKQPEIDSHYRYTEFSINGTLALMPFSIVFPVFARWELHLALIPSALIAVILALITGFLSSVAIRNIADWEEVRSDLVFGTLDKPTGAPGE